MTPSERVRRQRQSERDRALDDDRVMTFSEWCRVNGFSEATGRRLRRAGKADLVNDLGKGGEEFKGPFGVSVSRNITSHKEKGIGAWTDAEIKGAVTRGERKDGTK